MKKVAKVYEVKFIDGRVERVYQAFLRSFIKAHKKHIYGYTIAK